ncbi:MAG TPA: sulfite exporter TauE/SafE family protein [Acidimicrobiia bacterium]|nr:sulfite exporter TauE/SafE family protein [Acidimicrobiia bacterium]
MTEPAVTPWKLVLIGFAAGILSGGFGVGGGIVLVPLLVAVGMGRHRAHATSLASIFPIAAAGAIVFALSGEVDIGLGVAVGLGGVVGSIGGASLMNRMSTRSLSIFFALVLLAAGIRMIVSSDPLPSSSGLDDLTLAAIAFGIGLVSGFFAGVAGVGGGVVIVPATVMLLGFSQHQAQGTSLLAIILTSVAATIINRKNRRVSLTDAVTVGLGGVAGSLLASRAALGIDGRILSIGFGVLAVLVALRTLYRDLVNRPEAAPSAEAV